MAMTELYEQRHLSLYEESVWVLSDFYHTQQCVPKCSLGIPR